MSEYIYEHVPSGVDATGKSVDAPTLVQHEEIVRCKDCMRFIPQGTYRFNSGVANKATCDVIRGFVVEIDPDGFCAWSERG